ncbi:MAG: 4Fe-4S binding protein [Candidatus Eisenbacteria sp.]|nr:4Fe-4S binding protein [Candidatus Eisenbacteria bacterium]
MKVLQAIHMERCIGCHSCSLACARLVHQRLSWDTAGIRIVSAGGLTTGFNARLCLACDPAPCAAACPTEAFSQRRGGGVIVRIERCIRCGACAETCPVNAIYLDERGQPYVCIHCGRCVPFCPHDCLELVTVEATDTAPVTPTDTAPVAPTDTAHMAPDPGEDAVREESGPGSGSGAARNERGPTDAGGPGDAG